MREYWRERRKLKGQNKRERITRELLPKSGPSGSPATPEQRAQPVESESTDYSMTGTDRDELSVIRDVGVPTQLLAGFNHALASSRLDPFDTFPITLTSEHHKLMHHCLFYEYLSFEDVV